MHRCVSTYMVTWLHTYNYTIHLYRYLFLILSSMALLAKDAVKQFKVELLKQLPLDEAIFFAMADKAGLFPLSSGDSIKAEKTRAEKVAYFLQYVVEPAAEIYLPKLLEVMKNSEVVNVQKLACNIQEALEPGTYMCVYVCVLCVCVCVCLCVCVRMYVYVSYVYVHVFSMLYIEIIQDKYDIIVITHCQVRGEAVDKS